MRFVEILLNRIGRYSFTKNFFQSCIKKMVLRNKTRNYLNSFYNYMNYQEREIFHYLFSRIFRDTNNIGLRAIWSINFANSSIDIPIHGDSIWLHWDTSISIVGHEIEIKNFYEKLIKSKYKPTCFFDIGANYGTHSILFLANGINTVSFEPNPNCEKYFKQMAMQNELEYQLENVAVSDKTGHASLMFPKKDTWLGSISDNYQNNLQNFEDVESINVETLTLDDYVQLKNIRPDLIKIDTEGFEINVLRGAKNIIEQLELLIIFESNQKSERMDLLQEFRNMNYQLYDLRQLNSTLNDESFLTSKASNFLAISSDHRILEDIKTFA